MPRKASGICTRFSRGPAFPRRSLLSCAMPGVAAPRLSSGIYAPTVRTIPRRENRSNIRPLVRTNRKREIWKEREREEKKRDEILQDGWNFILADGDDYDIFPPPWHLPLCFAPAIRVDGLVNLTEIAIHLLSVCLSSFLYPRMLDLDIFRRDFILRF